MRHLPVMPLQDGRNGLRLLGSDKGIARVSESVSRTALGGKGLIAL